MVKDRWMMAIHVYVRLVHPYRGRRFRVRRWPFLPPHAVSALVKWGRTHYRQYRWRQSGNPFEILVAEMLLRRTTASQVAAVFGDVISRYNSLEKLALASEQDLREALRPTGLSAQRARALRGMARHVTQHFGGVVPASPTLLAQIPHVGPYVANAVACFAFGVPVPVVDTNIIRILDRFTGVPPRGSNPHKEKSIWECARRSLPREAVRDHNYALLDLGALVCRASSPTCRVCPLLKGCAYAKDKV